MGRYDELQGHDPAAEDELDAADAPVEQTEVPAEQVEVVKQVK